MRNGHFRDRSNGPLAALARHARTLALALLALAGATIGAAASDLATPVYVTNGEIAASFQRNGYSQAFSQAAANLSSNVEDRSGDLAIYNGSCCTGILQMNVSNLQQYCGCSSAQYAAMSVDQQTKIWGQLTTDGFRAAAIKQMNQLTTFDGQPVDDAMKLACIQLGSGNCNKMIASGSCSGFADRNGTTICSMAASIRSGAPGTNTPPPGTKSAANGTDNTITGGDNTVGEAEDTKSMNGNGLPMGNPTYCWSCDVIVYALSIAEVSVSGGVQSLAALLLPLMVACAGIGIGYRILLAVAAGLDPVRFAGPTAARAALVLAILSAGSGAMGDLAMNGLLTPVIVGGSGMGQGIANSIAANFNIALDNLQPVQGQDTIPVTNDCSYNATSQVRLTYLIKAEASATSLACTIHHVETTEVQVGIFLANADESASTVQQKIEGAAVNVVGILMSVVGMAGMLKFGLIFLDVIVSLSVAMAFSPWALYCWIFASTKRGFEQLWRRLVQAFLSLVVAGVAAVAALVLVLTGMHAGLGLGGTTLDPGQILVAAQNLIVAMDLNNGPTTAKVAQFVFFTLGGALGANHVLGQSQQVTGAITGVRVSNALSKAATSAMATLSTTVLTGGGAIAGVFGTAFGRGAASMAVSIADGD